MVIVITSCPQISLLLFAFEPQAAVAVLRMAVLKIYSWFYTQGSFLMGFGEPHGTSGIKPGSDAFKTGVLYIVLLLQSQMSLLLLQDMCDSVCTMFITSITMPRNGLLGWEISNYLVVSSPLSSKGVDLTNLIAQLEC